MISIKLHISQEYQLCRHDQVSGEKQNSGISERVPDIGTGWQPRANGHPNGLAHKLPQNKKMGKAETESGRLHFNWTRIRLSTFNSEFLFILLCDCNHMNSHFALNELI